MRTAISQREMARHTLDWCRHGTGMTEFEIRENVTSEPRRRNHSPSLLFLLPLSFFFVFACVWHDENDPRSGSAPPEDAHRHSLTQ
jgi:hypothetical protein